MRTCPNCKAELTDEAFRLGRCEHCGSAVRNLSQRSIEDPRALRGQSLPEVPVTPESSDAPAPSTPGPTIDISKSDTADARPPVESLSDSFELADEPPKTPTIHGQSDLTIDFDALPQADEAGQPTRRSTHTFESDATIDLVALSPEDAQRLSSQWSGTFELQGKQGQTIRQKETISGFRSSLPVKSRFVRRRDEAGQRKPASPAEVPDYELLDVIGEGGMGVVYSAHQSSIARTVAVKMLKPSAKVGDEQRDKFISEAVVTGELDHPNIVPIYDLGANEEGALFYSMKRVKGTPWDKVLRKKSLDENLNILLRVADAVAFAHAAGVVHRDLKPENVMLGDFGEVLVMDWGLARITSAFANADTVFQAESLGGTPAYMSPEMARGPVERINFTSDVYLLGAILYEIIGGRTPHSGRDVMQCLMNAAQNLIDPINYDGELKAIALRALATRQQDRYQTVKEFQEAVRLYQAHAESLVLGQHAERHLADARTSGEYQLFARAMYGFQESLTLWDGNDRARKLLGETRFDYAKSALDKGDLDLAASLLEAENEEHAPLRKAIDQATVERAARQRRLRNAKRMVAALILAIIGILGVSYVQISRKHAIAVEAQASEKVQREEAEIARDEAVEAQVLEAEARAQEMIARELAEKERAAAIEAQKLEAEARQVAEEAKQAEEYEAYIARIGLAAAKIDENAYDYALELLQECKPDLRNWEWGRLVYLCQLNTHSYPSDGPVDAVAYAPDGKHALSGDWSGQATIRNLETGEAEHAFKHGKYVHAVAYSADGNRIATGSSDRKVRVLDAHTGELLRSLEGHEGGILSVRFSPDGHRLLSSGYDNTARLWDLDTEQPLQVFIGHTWWVWSAAFSPDQRRIVTAGQDGRAVVWQLRDVNDQGGDLYEKLTEFSGHNGAVYAAAFSPDGKLVATGGYDNLVMLWDPEQVHEVDIGRQLDGLPAPASSYLRLVGHEGPVRTVAFSPDGLRLLSGGHDNAVRLWDVASGEPIKMLRGHSGRVQACAFSPDGKWVLSGAHDQSVRLWNVEGYEEVRVLKGKVLKGHADAILSAQFSSDGKQIVTASRDRTAMLWDATTGKSLRHFEEGHEFLASTATFFADGKRMATGAGDNSVRIWDVASGTELAALSPTGRMGTVAVSPDGLLAVTGSAGNDAQLWNTETGKRIAVLVDHPTEVTAATFTPDGKNIITGDDRGNIVVWKQGDALNKWSLANRLEGHSREIVALRLAPGGSRLISASGDNTCGQWDLATGSELRELTLKHPDRVSSMDVSADGQWAVTTCDDGIVRLWSLDNAHVLRSLRPGQHLFNTVCFAPAGRAVLLTSAGGGEVRLWPVEEVFVQNSPPLDGVSLVEASEDSAVATKVILNAEQLGGMIWSAIFAPDGNHVLTIGGNDARLWSTSPRAEVVRFSPHGTVASVAMSPDGRFVATASWDSTIKLWDSGTGRAVRRLVGGHRGYINSIEFSPDGNELLTGSDDQTARSWNARDGKPINVVLAGHQGRINQATYSPDGRRVLTVSADKTARIWNRATGREELALKGHEWAVLCGKFSADGIHVITGSEDDTARIWDARDGKLIVTLAGHTASVSSVAISPDGRRALTGSQDNTAKLWDTRTGDEILSLTGHEQEITSVSFSPNGRDALSASRDGTAIVWLAADWHKRHSEASPQAAAVSAAR